MWEKGFTLREENKPGELDIWTNRGKRVIGKI